MKPSRWPGRHCLPALAVPLVIAGALNGVPAMASVPGCGSPAALPPAGDSELHGVAALSSSNVWVVGAYSTSNPYLAHTLIEHWDGSGWTQVPSPNPGSFGDSLSSVSAVSPTDIWAVGRYDTGLDLQTLVLHWDGTAWTQVPSPNPRSGEDADNELSGVRAVSATNIWSVGFYRNRVDAPAHTLIEHWDGTAWTRMPSPNPGGSSGNDSLSGVAATSATSAWAVGSLGWGARTLILRWNGSSWRRVPSPSPDSLNALSGVRIISSRNIWAVGGDSDTGTTFHTLVLHWNGSSWKHVASPNPGSTESTLFGLAATSPASVWAVGRYDNALGDYQILIEHWNGTAWKQVKNPNLAGALYGAGASPIRVWAVGKSAGQALALRCA